MNIHLTPNRSAAISLLLALLLPLPAPAQSPPGPESNARYLFLVDTSSATRRRAPAMLKAISNLMLSSMNAELRRGDSVGVWTFNEGLYTGQFPLQRWTPEATELIASNVVAFLKSQTYEKNSRFEVVQPALEQLVRSSERLTVLLISDGNPNISGTPFDREIRGVFQREFEKQRKAKMPFITVLRSSRGQFVNATVNSAPWPVEFPPFPPPPKIVAAPKAAEPEPPRPTLPPLIIIGKKPEPTEITNAAAVAVTNTPPPVESKPEPPPAAVATAVETKKESPAPAAPAPSPLTNPAPALLAPGSTPPPTTTVAVVESPKPAPTPVAEPKTELPPVVLAAQPPVTSNTATENLSPEISAPVTNAPALVALAVPPEPAFSRLGLLGIGLAILLLAGGLFFLMQHRARAATQASLITRSMDHDRK